jgi:FolB domain-containing protein
VSADCIFVRDLLVRAIIGINDWEREKKQDVLINLELDRNLRPAAASDDVGDALNYRTLTKAVIAHVETSSYQLVETLAEAIARICLEHGAERARVRVEKPGALRFAASVGVEIVRDGTTTS